MKALLIGLLALGSTLVFAKSYEVHPQDIDVRINGGTYFQALLTSNNYVQLVLLTGNTVKSVKLVRVCDAGSVNSVLESCAAKIKKTIDQAKKNGTSILVDSETKKVTLVHSN